MADRTSSAALIPHRERLFWQVVTRALTSPPSLLLLTSGLLLTVTPQAWAAGLGLLAAETLWLWTCIRNPANARASNSDLQRRRWEELVARLEAMNSVLDRDTAVTLAAILEGQERLLAACGGTTTHVLPHTRGELLQLLSHCLSLAEKRYRLQSHLASANIPEVRRQAEHLEARRASVFDPVTCELYARALEQKHQELDNYTRLEETIARIDGQLAAVRCTFDNMVSKVLRAQTAHPGEGELPTDAVFEELNQLANGVAALESSLDEVITTRSSG